MKSKTAMLTLALTLTLTQTACGSSDSPAGASADTSNTPVESESTTANDGISTSEPLPSSTPSPQETPSAVTPLLTDTFTDDDGYAFVFEMESAEISFEKDIANAKPGEVHLFVSVAATGTISNTTVGRNAEPPDIEYAAVWESDSDFCRLAVTSVVPGFYGPLESEEGYCRISNGALFGSDAPSELGIDESRAVAATQANVLPIVVKEEDLALVEASLPNPYAHVIGRIHNGRWTPDTFDCGIKNGGGYLSASSAEIIGCTRFTS